jgi:bisphosphoglycerate-dependent phosphoglycerate mutase
LIFKFGNAAVRVLRREFKIKVIIIRDNEKMQHCPTLNFNKTSSKFHQRLAEAKECRGEDRVRRLCSYYKDGWVAEVYAKFPTTEEEREVEK